jgi:serine/threonine protein phosphatase PrpC
MNTSALKFETASLSEPGGRRENQDVIDFAVLDGFGCWVVADGLGGHGGGAKAAKTAVETILGCFRAAPSQRLQSLGEYLQMANAAICELQDREPQWSRMSTTLVALMADSRSSLWGHVGDSRLYLFRAGRIQFQTKDHSVPQALCNAGEITAAEIRFHEDRNRLLRSLGSRDRFNPTIQESAIALQPGDSFLLCTDGFWEYVSENCMEDDLGTAHSADDWLRRMEAKLLRQARGEHDNYSALAVLVAPA